jgi:polyisoprenoid-binding protein YceI
MCGCEKAGKRPFARAVLALIAALLAACAAERPAQYPAGASRPADFPNGYYLGLAEHGQAVYRIDPGRSLVVIEVRRAGSLAQLGHDHVIACHTVTGYVAPGTGRADLYAMLDSLVVDEPALRDEAGFETHPSPADVAATRRNMLDRVLESDRYPFARVAVNGAVADEREQRLRVAVTLHGTTQYVDAAVRLHTTAEESLVTGHLAIDQSRFGIVPFSILGGAIAVQDRVDIKFRLSADRVR